MVECSPVSMTFGDYSFSPVPQLTISHDVIKDGTGNVISVGTRASLDGVLLAMPSGGLGALQPLKQAFEDAILDCSGCKRFTLVCGSGEPTVDAYARVSSIEFTPSSDNWIFTIPYTLQLEWNVGSDILLGSGTCFQCVNRVQDDWTLNILETPRQFTVAGCDSGPTFVEIQHNVSAVGTDCCISGVDTPGWESAKSWVLDRLGMDNEMLAGSGVFNFSPNQMSVYEHSRSQNVNKLDGNFSVDERWVVIDQSGAVPYVEEYTVNTSTSSDSPFRTVSIQGSIQGLEIRDSNFNILTDKYQAAVSGWEAVESNLITRVNCLSSGGICPINAIPTTTSLSRNPGAGTITYGYDYNDKPTLVANAKFENISITETRPSEQVTEVNVIGRAAGPILVAAGSMNTRRRNVSIDIVLAPTGCTTGTLCTDVNNAINSLPRDRVEDLLCCIETNLTDNYDVVHRVEDQESYALAGFTYSRQVAWLFQKCTDTLPVSGDFCD